MGARTSRAKTIVHGDRWVWVLCELRLERFGREAGLFCDLRAKYQEGLVRAADMCEHAGTRKRVGGEVCGE
eukprot:scaffold88077_cov36-Tisochrysis_lutea.AAC.2